VVGRGLELEAAKRFLDAVAAGPAVLVFRGEPGIGKTTVCRATVERAQARGYQVLACRPAEAEAKLSYAGLTDVLVAVATDDALARLPSPQRQALEVALLRSAPGAHAPEARVVYAAFGSFLAELAQEAPVVVSVDDVQWLDRPSRAALEFVLRRLGGRRIGALLVERAGGEPALAPSLLRALDEAGGRAPHARPPERGRAPRRPGVSARARARLAQASRGNPFYALEIARELERHGELSAGEALPIPSDLSELVSARIRRLPAATRDALLTAAALASPALSLVDRAALEPAASAGLVQLGGDRAAFAHPLFASAVYRSAGDAERRELHGRLAALVPDAEERARHLALAAAGPSEEIAVALEEAAAEARSRGSPESAAELMELAVRLTPLDDGARRAARTLAASEHHFRAGDLARSRLLAQRALDGAPAGATRGHALRLLGEIRYHESSFSEAVPLFEQALTLLVDDPRRVDLHVNLAYAYVNLGDVAAAVPHALAGVEAAEGAGDDGLLAVALAVSTIIRFYAGERLDLDMLERALALEDPDRQIVMPMRPSLIAGVALDISDELGRAEELLTALRERTLERGEDSDLPLLSTQLAMVARNRGRPEQALRYLDEGYEIARIVGSDTGRVLVLAERCHSHGLLGLEERARADAEEAERLATESGYRLGEAWTRWAMASLELSLGNAAAARERLEPVVQMVAARGACDPPSSHFLPEAIEALVGTGELDRAEVLVGILDEHGRFHDRRSALAAAARGRALLLGARGDVAGAVEQVDVALAFAPGDLPVQLGRALLVKGQLERRARRRRAARQSLERAAALFESVGAALWAERAQAELERTGRRRVPADELTPSERRVAQLATEGLTNRRIAESLFLSPKTVEANLARVYRKLGMRTRAELGRVMAERKRALTE